MGTLGKVYKSALSKYPLLTQALQTGALMGTGDAIAQLAIEKKSLTEFNWVRSAQFSSLGVCLVGPTLTTWYTILARKFGAGGAAVAARKVACDQLLFAPVFIAVFLGSLGTVQLRSWQEIQANVRRDYADILATNYKIWPAAQVINFAVMPLQYQVLFVQVVAIFWNCYLSWKTQQQSQDTLEESFN